MTLRSEDPPPPGNIAVATPPASERPTTAMLKADIDSGRTGDKVAHYDPGLSQLGTDDEAAGHTPSHDRIALARETEAASPRVREAAKPHGRNAWVLPLFAGFVLLIPLVIGALLFVLNR
jgi:hypothetical protein